MIQIDNMEMPTACTKETYTKDGYVYEHCKFFENCNKAVLLRNNFKPVDCPLKEVNAKPKGKWITYKDEHQCSCCKEIIIVSDDYWNDNEYDYCPYCGAKMEQGEIK